MGSRFRKDGVGLVVVRTERAACDGCYYEVDGGAGCDCIRVSNLGECRQLLRTDNENIIFKPIKKEQR